MPDPSNRVLVVDDDDAIRLMVERVLKRERFHVESARDGQEAIEKLSNDEFGTVILDLMMPRVDGHGVLRFLDERREGQPRVIIMTASLHDAAATREKKPVFRILPKPFEIRDLVAHVRDCLQNAIG